MKDSPRFARYDEETACSKPCSKWYQSHGALDLGFKGFIGVRKNRNYGFWFEGSRMLKMRMVEEKKHAGEEVKNF
ncbi:hypothetical protein Tco_0858977 [Tanacetum coccineum]|uniref:Uncharacterized protein n=1 Tax=Tanacetum coccineum TaxID=301880 RepID=A0ABQ5BAT9_9ASTR